MLKSLLPLVLIFSLGAPSIAQTNDTPQDFAVALRETPIYESLEVYAEILRKASPKDVFKALSVTEDAYGIMWVQVEIDKKTTGYLTDAVVLRKKRKELDSLLDMISLEGLQNWDQETVESVEMTDIEVGMTQTQLLLTAGAPNEVNDLNGRREFVYDRSKILLKNGVIEAFNQVLSTPSDRNIEMVIELNDPEFTPVGGTWQDVKVGETTFKTETTGSGIARYRLSLPADGKYRLKAIWHADSGNSADVVIRISRRGTDLALFRVNHKLYDNKWTVAGDFETEANKPFSVEIHSEDGLPISIGSIVFSYVNEPIP